MAQNTLRLHLNTTDGISADPLSKENQAWRRFDLRKCGIKARPNSKLSVALIKACVPPTTSAFSSPSQLPIIGFKLENPVPAPNAPAVANTELKLFNSYAVNSDRQPAIWKWSSTVQRTSWLKNIDYQTDVKGIVRVLNDMVNSQYTAGNIDPFRVGTSSDKFGVDSAWAGSFTFYNKYFQKDKPEYNPAAERLYGWLGIDTKSTAEFTRLGSFNTTDTEAPYQTSTYQTPLLVFCNLQLNSVGSLDKGSHTNILSSIPIEMGVRVAENVASGGLLTSHTTPQSSNLPHLDWLGVKATNVKDSQPWDWVGNYVDDDKDIFGTMLPSDIVPPPSGNHFPDCPTPINGCMLDPNDANQIYFFVGTNYYIFKMDTQEKVSGPHITNNTFIGNTNVKNAFRNQRQGGGNTFSQVIIYDDNNYFTRYSATSNPLWDTDLNSTFWHNQENWTDYDATTMIHDPERMRFKDDTFWIGANIGGSFVGWAQYGGSGQYFEGLPHYLDGMITDDLGATSWAFKDNVMYELGIDKTNHTYTVVGQVGFGGGASGGSPTTPAKINFDGADDYVDINGLDDRALNWTKSWSLGITAEEIHNPTDGTKRTIFRRGTNAILFLYQSGNVGFYASATDGIHDPTNNNNMSWGHGANSWTSMPSSAKWLFTYNHTTGKLRWYSDDGTGSCLKATIQMTAAEMTVGVSASTPLQVARTMGGYYGGTFFDGHLDDLLIVNSNLVDGSQQITDYFTDDNFTTHEYANLITNYFTMGEDAYPNLVDSVGSATGEHFDGTSGDFMNMSGGSLPVSTIVPNNNYEFTIETNADPTLHEIILYKKPTDYTATRWYKYDINPNDSQELRWKSSWDNNYTDGTTGVVNDTEWKINTEGANWYQMSGMGNTVSNSDTLNTEAMIDKINYHPDESHKIIDADTVNELELYLTDATGEMRGSMENIYYEVEFKEVFED